MEAWIQEAVSQWKDEGIEVNQGVSIADIEKVESQIRYKFPDDFKELYSIVNGFVDVEWKRSMVSLWSLERIKNDYTESKKMIMFSDFFISTCQYGFHKNQAGIYKAYSHFQHEPVEFIAESFQRVIGLINCDADILF